MRSIILLPLILSAGLYGCAAAGPSALPQPAACDSRVTVAQLLNERTLRLDDGKVVELASPQLFLSAPSPEQPDYFALTKELLDHLKRHLEGRSVTADLAGSALSLCGEDRVALGTGLVSQGLLYQEQVTGPMEAVDREQWSRLEHSARQQRLGLWKKGPVGDRPFDRVARLTRTSAGDQRLFEIGYDGTVFGARRKLAPEQVAQLRAIVAQSATVIMPRDPTFWQLCCDAQAEWFRVYYPRREGAAQAADYLESAELATFFRRIDDALQAIESPGAAPEFR
ncbi:MAG: hypothetical protein AB1515_10820 [Nitrospirota bacterium]